MTVWFDFFFLVQANKQSVLLAPRRKVLCTQMPVVILLITFKFTIYFIRGNDYAAEK